MKVFDVKGSNWINSVEINNENYDKYSNMAMEAMAQSFDAFMKNEINSDEELELGLVMTCHEQGCEGQLDKEIICLSYLVAENAGYPEIAKAMRQEIDKVQSQMRDERNK
tara:strand:- start:75 stop:404 length:330 start_codon:yes stop_codon:yes gene_type:complete